MTICVSVKVSEGLVLAADSTASIQGALQDQKGNQTIGILKTYDNAQKLSHLNDYPIGTLTWGISQIGSRTVASLIKEYEYSLSSLEEENQKIRELRMRGAHVDTNSYQYNVKDISRGLFEHVKKYYEIEFSKIPSEKRPPLGILVSGYSSNNFFPDQWLLDFPTSNDINELRPDVNGKPSFGANWFGLTDAIIRLHWGRDDQIIDLIANHFKVPVDDIKSLVDRFQYPVAFEGMPLQDAIDYTVYLVNVAIGRFRFVVGAPLCGGEIDVSVITPNSFTWVRRKSWKA
ncbi:MAG: hypothetical protein L0Z71_03795 [Anaerolineae bacterium]|nr:hypothetical protein [Anaerolineae bacterium]